METDEVIMISTVAFLLVSLVRQKNRREEKKRIRRYAVRPLNRKRRIHGNFESLFKVMKSIDDEQFFKYTRMSSQLFDHLMTVVGHRLTKRKTMYTVSPEQRMCITLHYLAEGCSMQEMAFNFHLGKATIHCTIKETTAAIWETLAPIYVPPPSQDDLVEATKQFYRRWNMPNCCGAIDGKHVQIQSPKYSGSDYFNYHSTYSIVLMASCDAFYKFQYVDIGSPGSNHDSSVFRTSGFGEAIINDFIQFPGDRCLPRTEVSLPAFFVADQAFPLSKRIMRPFPGRNIGEKENIFNYRLSRARRIIENTFGILAQRWRILRGPIIGDLEMCESIIKATIVLHNYVQKEEWEIPEESRKYCPTRYVDYEDEDGGLIPGAWRKDGNILKSVGRMGSNNTSQRVRKMRNILADYFVSDVGMLPWQSTYVNRGRLPNI